MLKTIKLLLDAAGSRAENKLQDRFAIDLLEKHVRDADAGLAAAKQTLVTILVRERTELASLSRLDHRIADLEQRTRSALRAGEGELAHAGGSAIAELENERAVRRSTVLALGERAARMRFSIEKMHRRIIDLKQGMISAKAIDAEHKAQRLLNRSLGNETSLRQAEALIAQIHDRDDPFEEAMALEAIDAELSHETVVDRLAEAGHGSPTKISAEIVLQRLTAA